MQQFARNSLTLSSNFLHVLPLKAGLPCFNSRSILLAFVHNNISFSKSVSMCAYNTFTTPSIKCSSWGGMIFKNGVLESSCENWRVDTIFEFLRLFFQCTCSRPISVILFNISNHSQCTSLFKFSCFYIAICTRKRLLCDIIPAIIFAIFKSHATVPGKLFVCTAEDNFDTFL